MSLISCVDKQLQMKQLLLKLFLSSNTERAIQTTYSVLHWRVLMKYGMYHFFFEFKTANLATAQNLKL